MGEKQYGRYSRKPKTHRYWANRRREQNELKRILRSNGPKEAMRWARKRMCVSLLTGVDGAG